MELYILRHGSAKEAAPGGSDSERSLTDEGREELRKVLRRAHFAKASPSLILTSPYLRAVQTAEIAAELLGNKQKLVRTNALLPASSPQEVWAEIRSCKDEEQILLAGHEPLLGQCVSYLLGAPALRVDMKKAALVCITLDRFGSEPAGILRWMLVPRLAG